MTELIANIQIGQRFREDMGDIESLKASIEKLGLLHPVVISTDRVLIAGERRIQACQAMGWEEIPVTVVDLDSGLWLVAERDENLERKDMTVSEMVALAKVLEIQIGKRQGARSDVKSRKDVQPSENGHSEKKPLINRETKPEKSGSELQHGGAEVKKGQQVREVVAKKAGFESHHSLEMAKRIQELGSQALKEIVDDKAVSISDAASICSEGHDTQTKAVSRVALRQAKTLKAAVAAIHAEQEDHGQADPVQDCNGINIPDNVREFYEEAKAFDEAIGKAKELRFALNAIDKTATSKLLRQRGKLQDYCTSIESDLSLNRFGFVCPACEGNDDNNCNCCENRRWFKASDIGKVDLKKYRRGK